MTKVDWRARVVEYLGAHGGELVANRSRHPYGVSGVLRERVRYPSGGTSWSSLMRRMENEGLIVMVDRSAKRVWHIRLGEAGTARGEHEDDRDTIDGLRDLTFPQKVVSQPKTAMAARKGQVAGDRDLDYGKLAWALLGAATEAVSKPGVRNAKLEADNKALKKRLADAEQRLTELVEEFDEYRSQFEIPDNAKAIIEGFATELITPPE